MAVTSLQFLLLVLATLILYYAVPAKMQWWILLIASYVFYLSGGIVMGGYLIFITLLTYGAGRLLGYINSKKGEWDKKIWKARKKIVTGITLFICFALLFALKYLDGALLTLNHWLNSSFSPLGLLVPLGISYYIFQSCGYVIDCHRGKYPIERNVAKYALFVSFFPQMVQGPINRHRDLAPQLTAVHRLDATRLRDGCQLILWGLFKKLLIADRTGVVVNTVLSKYTEYSGSVIMFAILFYCMQLYCDFSGGIDIVRGVATLFGIDLPQNFRRPLFAVSVADYWRRWHITLGGWMRDYVFYSLSLSRPFSTFGRFVRKHFKGVAGKILPTSVATFIVYLFIGIWHGSDPKFIVFGFWNGIIITASLLLESTFEKTCSKLHIRRESTYWKIFCIMRTSIIVFAGRYLTRGATLGAALQMLKLSVCNFSFKPLINGTLMDLGLTATDYIVIALAMACVLLIEFLQERGLQIRKTLGNKNGFVQFTVLFLLLASLFVFGWWIKGDMDPGFIYAQF